MENSVEKLIQKLYDQSCTPEEMDKLFELVPTLPEKIAAKVMEELWKQSENFASPKGNTSSKMYDNILGKIKENKGTTSENKQKVIPISRTRTRVFAWSSAAAIALLLVGLFLWNWTNTQNHSIYTTAFGEQESINLPDGSTVTLNANSTLRFDKHWDETAARKVWLQGEAFFEVAKKVETGQKFQVITKDLTVEVLGTIFNVNSHQKETKVFLEEGKVKLNLNGLKEAMLMEPGELVAYSETKKVPPAKRQVLAKVHTSWKDGLMLFDETPLKEVLEKVEEVYGVTIQIKDTVNYSRTITTGLPVENLEDAITILNTTMDLKIIKAADGFLIQ